MSGPAMDEMLYESYDGQLDWDSTKVADLRSLAERVEDGLLCGDDSGLPNDQIAALLRAKADKIEAALRAIDHATDDNYHELVKAIQFNYSGDWGVSNVREAWEKYDSPASVTQTPSKVTSESGGATPQAPSDPRECQDCGHLYYVLMKSCTKCGSEHTRFVDEETRVPTDGYGDRVAAEIDEEVGDSIVWRCINCETSRQHAIVEKHGKGLVTCECLSCGTRSDNIPEEARQRGSN